MAFSNVREAAVTDRAVLLL